MKQGLGEKGLEEREKEGESGGEGERELESNW